MRRLVWFALLLVVGAVWADRSPPSGQLTVMAAPWGEVYCSTRSSFSRDASGQRTTITHPRGAVQVVQAGRWLNLQFPGHTARVRPSEGELLVQFGGQNYRFVTKGKRELQLRFPGETVYYSLSEGGVRTILGPGGAVTVRKNTQKKSFEVTSEGGTSLYQVRAKPGKKSQDRELRLEVISGEGPERHPYFHRGVRFEDEGVGIFIPLGGGPLLQALDWKATRLVSFSPPPSASPAPVVVPVNPLKAQTITPGALKAQTGANSTLKAQVVAPGEDPLRTKSANQDPKYPTGPNPLKANIIPRGEDKLKVQEFDPTK